MKIKISKSLLAAAIISFTTNAFAIGTGYIYADHDEWRVSDRATERAGSSNISNFALNLASALKGNTGTGRFLVYSDNDISFGNTFTSSLTSAGHSITQLNSSLDTLPTDLNSYDGIFLSGSQGSASSESLTNFVNSGKGVAVFAGNSYIPNVEANRWNSFLSNFGLSFDNIYNGVQGVFSVSSSNSLYNGVSQLYHDNGNNVIKLSPENAYASIVLNGINGGLAGIYNGRNSNNGGGGGGTAVPEPSTIVLLSAAALGSISRKRKSA